LNRIIIVFLVCFFLAYLVIESDSFGTIKIHSMEEPIYYLCVGKDGRPVGIPKVSNIIFITPSVLLLKQ